MFMEGIYMHDGYTYAWGVLQTGVGQQQGKQLSEANTFVRFCSMHRPEKQEFWMSLAN